MANLLVEQKKQEETGQNAHSSPKQKNSNMKFKAIDKVWLPMSEKEHNQLGKYFKLWSNTNEEFKSLSALQQEKIHTLFDNLVGKKEFAMPSEAAVHWTSMFSDSFKGSAFLFNKKDALMGAYDFSVVEMEKLVRASLNLEKDPYFTQRISEFNANHQGSKGTVRYLLVSLSNAAKPVYDGDTKKFQGDFVLDVNGAKFGTILDVLRKSGFDDSEIKSIRDRFNTNEVH